MRDVTGGFRAVPDGLFRKRIARIARNCPFRHHYLFFFHLRHLTPSNTRYPRTVEPGLKSS
jgi:hypothetical protein